jgi:diguanylate cyclase (GGDEF)-like protein
VLPSTVALSTQQLAEFLAVVSSVPDRLSATQLATERAAKALEAEVAAVLDQDGTLVDLVGFPIGGAPTAELREVVTGARSVVNVPGAGPCRTAVATLGGRVRGYLLVARSGDDGFSPDELSLVRGMARVLELTVDTLHMFEVERREAAEKERLLASLQERHRLLEQISEVQRAITRRAPLQEILDAITAGAQTLLGDELAGLRLYDPDDPSMLLLVSCTGVASEVARRLWRVPADGAGVTGQAALRDELVVMPHPKDMADWTPELASRVHAAMAAPVHHKNTVVGALTVASLRPDRYYSPRDQQFLRVFAEQVSLAVTDAKTQEAMQQAFHDSLTGLASRTLLMDRLDHALASAARCGTDLATLFVDLDRFKLINDSLGHTAGDTVLVCVADRLRACLRPTDTAARLGGDEFAVVLHDVDRAGAVTVAARIIAALQAPFLIDGREVFVNASIGIALNTDRDADGQTMLNNADLAMYSAKMNGKGRYEIFEPTMRAMPMRLDLESDLHRALTADEFVLHYQPIVELPGGRVVAVEALVRWQDPAQGLTSPQKFIPLAEETGLILAIGRWVIHEACRQTSVWNARRHGEPPLMVSVNLSARQLQEPDLPDIVATSLADTGLDPGCLMLEITESQLLRDTGTTMDGLRRLKALGVRLAIDDFGTGYSSLTYLRQFPVDTVKIDRSFVSEIASPKGSALVRATVQFGHVMELTTIAEGIEDADQLRQLSESGCHLGQGYLFAKPLEPDEIEALLGIG